MVSSLVQRASKFMTSLVSDVDEEANTGLGCQNENWAIDFGLIRTQTLFATSGWAW